MTMNEADEQLEDMLSQLEGNTEDFIHRRIKHIGFAKVVFFLCVRARREDFIYARDLAEFRKITRQGASQILDDLVNVKLLRKNYKGDNMCEYWILKNDFDVPLINEYFKMACKTLRIKNKVVFENPQITKEVKRNGIY